MCQTGEWTRGNRPMREAYVRRLNVFHFSLADFFGFSALRSGVRPAATLVFLAIALLSCASRSRGVSFVLKRGHVFPQICVVGILKTSRPSRKTPVSNLCAA
jgi:hypothetical protein